jgi:Flp pilus assembly pilin Flp
MSTRNIASKWMKNLHGLRRDERGAESSEVILVLVLLVIGLLAAWAFLRDKIKERTSATGNCIEGAATTTNCG